MPGDGRARPHHSNCKLAVRSRLHPYCPGLCSADTLIVTFRSFRDFFASDIYTATLQRTPHPTIYVLADWPGGIASCLLMGFVVKIKDSRNAILALHGIVAFGAVLMLAAYGTFWRTIRYSCWLLVLVFFTQAIPHP